MNNSAAKDGIQERTRLGLSRGPGSKSRTVPGAQSRVKPESRLKVGPVGEIFREAGNAFNKLAEMTTMLDPIGDTQAGGKWTDDEVEMLRLCVHRFAVDLNKISQHIKNRTVSQIRATLKKKAFEDAGLPMQQVSSGSPQLSPSHLGSAALIQHNVLGQNAEVTLNMLNATESELDVESLSSDIKLEFDTSNDDVST